MKHTIFVFVFMLASFVAVMALKCYSNYAGYNRVTGEHSFHQGQLVTTECDSTSTNCYSGECRGTKFYGCIGDAKPCDLLDCVGSCTDNVCYQDLCNSPPTTTTTSTTTTTTRRTTTIKRNTDEIGDSENGLTFHHPAAFSLLVGINAVIVALGHFFL